MGSVNMPVQEKVFSTSELTYKAFILYEKTEERKIVSVLRMLLSIHRVCDESVFFHGHMGREPITDEARQSDALKSLSESEYLVVFLTPNFLQNKCSTLEISNFLDMKERDERKLLLPIFYRISAGQCEKRRNGKLNEKLAEASEELRQVLRKIKIQGGGIDAKGLELSDAEVVAKIMKLVFRVDIWNQRADYEDHDVNNCGEKYCYHPLCAYKKSSAMPEVTEQDLSYEAFLSHEGEQKRTVVDLLCRELDRKGIGKERVFFDKYMKKGGGKDGDLDSRLLKGLLASKYFIAFLTPDFLTKKYPMWELCTFLGMMDKDKKRRELFPVFYRISVEDYKSIFKKKMRDELKVKLAQSTYDITKLGSVLGKVDKIAALDAEKCEMADTAVVERIIEDVFEESNSQ